MAKVSAIQLTEFNIRLLECFNIDANNVQSFCLNAPGVSDIETLTVTIVPSEEMAQKLNALKRGDNG